MPTMYDIHRDFDALWTWLEETEGEVTPEIQALTEVAEADLREKSARYVHVIRDYEATIKGIKEEGARLNARAAAFGKRVGYLKGILLECVECYGKYEAGSTTISRRKSTYVEITGEVPESYMVQPPPPDARPDKKAITKALKAGQEVAGAAMGTRFSLALK